MEKCTQLKNHDIGDFEGESEFTNGLNIPIERYRFDSCKERLRGLFNQVLVSFLRERYGCKRIRPIPVLCGNGRPLDLFKLFWVVRKIGGYDAVTVNNSWAFVLDECGLFRGLVPSVKLIYRQYLNHFDRWFGQGYGERDCDDGISVVEKLDSFYQDLKTKFGFVNNCAEHDMERVGSNLDGSECMLHHLSPDVKDNSAIDLSDKGGEKLRTNEDVRTLMKRVSENIICNLYGDDEKSCVDSDFDALAKNVVKEKTMNEENESFQEQSDDRGKFCDKNIVLSKKVVEANEKVVKSRKRKRESQSWMGMLNWLKNVAKNSDDPLIGKLPERSKWSSYGSNESWMQALLVRDSLLLRRNTKANEVEQPLKDHNKNPQMHPTTYEDDLRHKTLRSSRISSTKSHLCSCCYSHEEHESKLTVREETNTRSSRKLNDNESSSVNFSPEKSISIGPQFQAEIPELTGNISQSDPKWLGQKLWPQENGNNRSSILALDPIGKGRRGSSCDCPFPNSVECVRFHIAEKKLGLKRELGSVFYRWGFDRMGEEVSLSWTAEDEKRFKDIVRSCGAFSKEFWNKVSRSLPTKTRQRVAAYYLDVYLVQRRSYQNRVTPKDVDSDDDKIECGLIGEGFGYKALCNPGSRLVSSCTMNTLGH